MFKDQEKSSNVIDDHSFDYLTKIKITFLGLVLFANSGVINLIPNNSSPKTLPSLKSPDNTYVSPVIKKLANEITLAKEGYSIPITSSENSINCQAIVVQTKSHTYAAYDNRQNPDFTNSSLTTAIMMDIVPLLSPSLDRQTDAYLKNNHLVDRYNHPINITANLSSLG